MTAYSVRINGEQVGIVLTKTDLGGNDKQLLALAFCSEYNASVSCAKVVWLGDSFCAIEVKQDHNSEVA